MVLVTAFVTEARLGGITAHSVACLLLQAAGIGTDADVGGVIAATRCTAAHLCRTVTALICSVTARLRIRAAIGIVAALSFWARHTVAAVADCIVIAAILTALQSVQATNAEIPFYTTARRATNTHKAFRVSVAVTFIVELQRAQGHIVLMAKRVVADTHFLRRREGLFRPHVEWLADPLSITPAKHTPVIATVIGVIVHRIAWLIPSTYAVTALHRRAEGGVKAHPAFNHVTVNATRAVDSSTYTRNRRIILRNMVAVAVAIRTSNAIVVGLFATVVRAAITRKDVTVVAILVNRFDIVTT